MYGISETGTILKMCFQLRNINRIFGICINPQPDRLAILSSFGELKKLNVHHDEYQTHLNISPIDVKRHSGKLYSFVPKDPKDIRMIVENENFFGFKFFYQCVSSPEVQAMFALMLSQTSEKRNIYGWIKFADIDPDEKNVQHVGPMSFLEHDADRVGPEMIGVSFDLEMCHTDDREGFCSGLVDEDEISMLCAVKFKICPAESGKRFITDRLYLLNGARRRKTFAEGDGDERVEILSSSLKLIARFVKWIKGAHVITGWNIAKYDNVQMMYKTFQNPHAQEMIPYLNVHNDITKFTDEFERNGERKNDMFFKGTRFCYEYQQLCDAMNMVKLYRNIKPKNHRLGSVCLEMGIPTKLDISFREMDTWYRSWINGGEYGTFGRHCMDYCFRDAEAVYDIIGKDLYTDLLFSVNVNHSLQDLNITYERLPFCDPFLLKYCMESLLVFDAIYKYQGNMYPMYSTTHAADYIMSVERTQEKDKKAKKYKGAEVFSPQPSLELEVAAVDYASLYPNCAIQYGFSDGTAFPVPEEMSHLFDDTIFHKTAVEISSIPLCVVSLKDDKFEQQGCMSGYLYNCLSKRDIVKKLAASATDPRFKMLYGASDKTYKVAANGAYGRLGMLQHHAGNKNMFCAMVYAAAITTIGRRFLNAARVIAESMGLRVIYGDTDSLYLASSRDNRELATSINKELVRMYMNNDFTIEGMRGEYSNSIALRLAGEANYKAMYIAAKKRYICLYKFEEDCLFCKYKHQKILFKNAPSPELIVMAHRAILEVHKLCEENSFEEAQKYLQNVLRLYVCRNDPVWTAQICKASSQYKMTPPILVRHVDAIGDYVGLQNDGPIEFTNIFPEKCYPPGTLVPKNYLDGYYIATKKEIGLIYSNVFAAECKVATHLFFLADMLTVLGVILKDIKLDSQVNRKRKLGDEPTVENDLEYRVATIYNTHIYERIQSDRERLKNFANLSSIVVYMLDPKFEYRKLNFLALFVKHNVLLPRIHSCVKNTDMTLEWKRDKGVDGFKFESERPSPLYFYQHLGNRLKLMFNYKNVFEEIADAMSLFRACNNGCNETHTSDVIIESLWGWYYVRMNGEVIFAPYCANLLEKLVQ